MLTIIPASYLPNLLLLSFWTLIVRTFNFGGKKYYSKFWNCYSNQIMNSTFCYSKDPTLQTLDRWIRPWKGVSASESKTETETWSFETETWPFEINTTPSRTETFEIRDRDRDQIYELLWIYEINTQVLRSPSLIRPKTYLFPRVINTALMFWCLFFFDVKIKALLEH